MIELFNGAYILYSDGRVWSNLTNRYLKPCLDGKKYRIVNLKKKTKKIHRLVAENFIPRVEGKNHVNHIDGNKDNNDISNLEWCTNQENALHAFRLGLRSNKGEDSPVAKLNDEKVREIRKKRKAGAKVKDLGKEYNVYFSTIKKVIYRNTWKHVE